MNWSGIKKTDIVYERWSSSSPKAVLLLVHGLGGHSTRWEFLSGFFLQNNISCYALELRGFGKTDGIRGHIDSFETYFDDIRRLHDIIVKENEGKKVFLAGESMGALIAFMMVINGSRSFDGLICLSPAFTSRLKLSLLDYARIASSLLFNSEKQFTMPFDAEMCTRDIDHQKVMDSDVLEHRFATAKLLFETLKAQVLSRVLNKKISISTLFLLSGEDKLVVSEDSENIFNSLKTADKEIIKYSEMYHALSIDTGREKVFADMLDWILRRT